MHSQSESKVTPDQQTLSLLTEVFFNPENLKKWQQERSITLKKINITLDQTGKPLSKPYQCKLPTSIGVIIDILTSEGDSTKKLSQIWEETERVLKKYKIDPASHHDK